MCKAVSAGCLSFDSRHDRYLLPRDSTFTGRSLCTPGVPRLSLTPPALVHKITRIPEGKLLPTSSHDRQSGLPRVSSFPAEDGPSFRGLHVRD